MSLQIRDGATRSVARVGVAYHQIAHYRRAVFDELNRSARFEFIVLSDTRAPDPSILLVDPASISWRWVVTPNLWIGSFLWQRGLVREVAFGDYEAFILLGNFLYLSSWVAAVVGRLRRKRVLFWTHGWLRRERGVKGFLRRRFYRLANALLVYGHWAKSLGVEAGFDPGRIHVVYNSLDYEAQRTLRESTPRERIDSVRRELFPQCDTPIAICSARLIQARRLEMLVEAAARLSGRGHPISLLLVGEGPARASLEALSCRRGVVVRFYGACYDEQRLAELTMAADVTVMPGPIGLTALQSLAYGTPVITHNDREAQNPEWEAIVPGENGDLFEPGDIEGLALAIARWTSKGRRSPDTVRACCGPIERQWNATTQRRVIERALEGLQADDLSW